MNRIYALLVAGLGALSAVTAANAATKDQQSHACRGDAIHFCSAEIPHREKIIACMKQHIDELSPACRAMFNNGKKAEAEPASQ